MERSSTDITVKNKLEEKQLFRRWCFASREHQRQVTNPSLHSRFKEVVKRTKPHKHDAYFEVIYLSEGAGFHWVDTEKFQITFSVVGVSRLASTNDKSPIHHYTS